MQRALLRKTERYRKDQVNSPEKIQLLWRNICDALKVEPLNAKPDGVIVDIQNHLFDDGAVTVTFSAFVRKRDDAED